MKALLSMTIILFFSQLCAVLAFNEVHHHPNTIVVCFNADAIYTTRGEISIRHNDLGQVQIGLQSFDALASQYDFVGLERKYKVRDTEWRDKNGAAPMNVFRIALRSNDSIEEAIYMLNADDSIIWAEFEPIFTMNYTPNDPQFAQQWHHPVIQTPELWNFVRGDSTIVIAIVDSGIKWNHEDLRANIYVNWTEVLSQPEGFAIDWENGTFIGPTTGIDHDDNGYINDFIGWEFHSSTRGTNNSFQSFRGNTHGTHVAGCAGAVGDNDIGVTGVAMNVRLLGTRHSPIDATSRFITNGYQGIFYAADSGAHIINCSWGSDGGAPGQSNLAINYAMDKGALVVAAAGNDNRDTSIQGHFPSDAEGVLSVGSSNRDDMKASHSNYGGTVLIMAPGEGIRSTMYSVSQTTGAVTDTYSASTGTSMASPIVAGVAGLIKLIHPEFTPEQIRMRIWETADPMIENEEYGDYWGLLGGGRLNAYKAVLVGVLPSLSVRNYPVITDIPSEPNMYNVQIRIMNAWGWATANATTATLTSPTSGVEIISGQLNFGNINSFTTTPPVSARISVDPSVNLSNINFVLHIKANQDPTNRFPYSTTALFNCDIMLSDDDIVESIYANELFQNFPNPFNPETTISFSIQNSEHVNLSIYNIKGQHIRTIVNDLMAAGEHCVVWNGFDDQNRQVSSGMYFYRIQTNSFMQNRKMILLK
jgi:hypothetical protein